MGTITPACYVWWRYLGEPRPRLLALGCLFTGLAMMTKGPFVMVPIFGGVFCVAVYGKRAFLMASPRWLLAYAGSFSAALPALVCLFLQFDAHPEKVVFGTTRVSGIGWFFWGSQFGRFLDTGPIVHHGGDPLYFAHTFLWIVIPWTSLWLFSLYRSVSGFRGLPAAVRERIVFLQGCFWPAFVMFSATRFQHQYYVHILVPFAAVLTAGGLTAWAAVPGAEESPARGDRAGAAGPPPFLARIQLWLTVLILSVAFVAPIAAFRWSWPSLAALPPAVLGIAMAVAIPRRSGARDDLWRLVVLPGAAALTLGLAVLVMMAVSYSPRKVGYAVAHGTGLDPSVPFHGDDQGVLREVRFHLGNPVVLSDRPPDRLPYYTLVKDGDFRNVSGRRYRIIKGFDAISGGFWFQGLFFPERLASSLNHFDLVEVTGMAGR